ncbi:MAG: hypothetical protein M0036_22530 [Desulfobacteraceae bacterium]|nr:hypothetical protein [Desulfobacteraceae bacterium]
MKDSTAPQIHELLPELFGKPGQAFKPGGMCTPGSGCGPATGDTPMDLLKLLGGSTMTPPASKEGADPTAGQEHPDSNTEKRPPK